MPSNELCEWSDLPVGECQHCKDGKKVVGTASKARLQYGDVVYDASDPFSGPSRVFPARYPGKCYCGQVIRESDPIYVHNGNVRHEHC